MYRQPTGAFHVARVMSSALMKFASANDVLSCQVRTVLIIDALGSVPAFPPLLPLTRSYRLSLVACCSWLNGRSLDLGRSWESVGLLGEGGCQGDDDWEWHGRAHEVALPAERLVFQPPPPPSAC